MSAQHGELSPLLKQSSDVVAAQGKGAYLYDENGDCWLDFTAGIGVLSTGHCHPHVVESAQAQAGKLIHGQYAIVKHSPIMQLADRLGGLMPQGIDRFFFSNAGTEAVEGAIRLVRQATGKSNIIAFRGGFHGRTMGALSLTSSSSPVRQGVQPMMSGVAHAPFPDTFWYGMDEATTNKLCLQEFDHLLHTVSTPAETAAVIIESVQGESGYVPANTEFMQALQARCREHGLLLITDEIQCGNGRTGEYWGFENFGITPDIVVTAKGIASGFPLSVLGASEQLMAKGWPGSQGGTYGGNAVSCAAGLATLDVIENEGLVENAAKRGEQLRARLEAIAAKHTGIADIRGAGLMLGCYMIDADGNPDGDRAARILKEAEQRGLLLIKCGAYGGQVVRWLPPLIVDEAQVDKAADIFEQALAATAA